MAVVLKSAGVEQNFADYSRKYDLALKARTVGLDPHELGFLVVRTGDYISASDQYVGHVTPNMYQNGDPFGRQFNDPTQYGQPQGAPHRGYKTHAPDVPYPSCKLRDDLEEQLMNRFKPRPY